MDSVEDDVSARVLLKHVLHTEVHTSQTHQLLSVRRSSRLRKSTQLESPQISLRHKLKQRLHESVGQSQQPPSKRIRPKDRSVILAAVTSSMFYDEMTPRSLLKGIIQTEPESSLLLSNQLVLPEKKQEASTQNIRMSEGSSGFDLPDLATEPLSLVIGRMSRRRPAPTFNVSAFERQLNQGAGDGTDRVPEDASIENTTVTREQDQSTVSKSVLSLTLKTPFENIPAERGGLRRKVAGRKKLSVAAFDEAVEKRLDRAHQGDGRVPGDASADNMTIPREQDLSAASKSVLSLTLKTPFVNIETERAGLRRRAGGRKQLSVAAFDEAIQRRLDRTPNQGRQSFLNDTSPDRFISIAAEPRPSSSLSKQSSPEVHLTYSAQEQSEEEVSGVEEQVSESENEDDVGTPAHLSSVPPFSQEEDQDEDDEYSDELSMKTPTFVRQKKMVATPAALSKPSVLKDLNAGRSLKAKKTPPKRRSRFTDDNVLPKSYVMNVFKHFAKTRVANDVYPIINEILQKYFDGLTDDLKAYATHSERNTIKVEDVELLMRRQGFVTYSMPVNVLIEKFLPLEYRKLLIPVATSGNKVLPEYRR